MSKHIDTIENSADKSTAPLAFDEGDYKAHLDNSDLTEAEKAKVIETLQTLWNIMSAFVDMGWGLDNMRLFFPELFNHTANEKFAPDSSTLLDSKNTPKEISVNNIKEGKQ